MARKKGGKKKTSGKAKEKVEAFAINSGAASVAGAALRNVEEAGAAGASSSPSTDDVAASLANMKVEDRSDVLTADEIWELYRAEKARADKAEVDKEAEKARAEAEKARAEKAEEDKEAEKARAEKAEEDKEAEKARAEKAEEDKEAEKANNNRLKGQAWATLHNVQHVLRKLREADEASSAEKDLANKFSQLFQKYIPSDLSRYQSCKSDCGRSPPVVIKRDLFNVLDSISAELAHLIPHSQCKLGWQRLLFLLTNIDYRTQDSSDQERFKMFLNGYRLKTVGSDQDSSRICHTGITFLIFNYILLRSQVDVLDKKPSLMLVPLLDIPQIEGWTGTGYRCLVIAKDPDVFRAIGATDDASEDSEVACNDPAVERAFESFQHFSAIVLEMMKGEEGVNDTSSKICVSFLKYLETVEYCHLPGNDSSCGKPYRVIAFGDALLPAPGSHVTATELLLPPAPHPFLLICRSLNAWITFLFLERLTKNGKPNFLEGMSVPPTSRNASACILLSSCFDFCEDGIMCAFCLAKHVLRNLMDFPELTVEELEALRNVVSGKPASEAVVAEGEAVVAEGEAVVDEREVVVAEWQAVAGEGVEVDLEALLKRLRTRQQQNMLSDAQQAMEMSSAAALDESPTLVGHGESCSGASDLADLPSLCTAFARAVSGSGDGGCVSPHHLGDKVDESDAPWGSSPSGPMERREEDGRPADSGSPSPPGSPPEGDGAVTLPVVGASPAKQQPELRDVP